MANIKLNGQNTIENMTCLTFAPAILEVSSSDGGSKTIYELTFSAFNGIGYEEGFEITVNGKKLTSTSNSGKANGYKFFLHDSAIDSEKKLMVNSILRALVRVPEIAAGYDAYIPTSNGEKEMEIVLESKSNGNLTPLEISTTIPFMTIAETIGTAETELKDGELNVDIFQHSTPLKYGASGTADKYITTLSKHTANDTSVKFDLGSVFGNLTEYGSVSQFGMTIYQTNKDSLTEIATYNNIYNTNGYLINQGGEYLTPFINVKLAANYYRGMNRDYLNNTILYLYENTIPLSFFVANSVNTISYNIKYIGTDGTTLLSVAETKNLPNPLSDITIDISDTYKEQCKYIDIEFTQYDLGTLRFNVIKPVKQTDEEQRLYWRNCYGGVSFFDFTGNRTEERKVDYTTYEDNIVNYYDNELNEKDIIFSKNNEITVTLSTHNIHRDSQWLLFDLQMARDAWTYINGEWYRVLVDDVVIEETGVENIFTAKVSYKYSMAVNI